MTIQTARLSLVPLEPVHANQLFEGLRDERLYEFISAVPPESVESLRKRYEQLTTRKSPDGNEVWLNWAIWMARDARYIGYVQATVRQGGAAEIAYVLFPEAWGKGFAREAVAAMMAHLRDCHGVKTIRALVDPRNAHSITLLQALGFTQAGYRVGADWIRGALADESEYVLALFERKGGSASEANW